MLSLPVRSKNEGDIKTNKLVKIVEDPGLSWFILISKVHITSRMFISSYHITLQGISFVKQQYFSFTRIIIEILFLWV